MKKAILVFSVILYIFNSAPCIYSQHANIGFYDKFYRGILDNGQKMTSYAPFSNLNIDLWMHYVNWQYGYPSTYGYGWNEPELIPNCPHDTLNNTNEYISEVAALLSQNSSNGYRTIGNRIKLDRLCYAERSDYFCNEQHIDSCYDFYSFAVHSTYDTDIQDFDYNGGKWVRYCPLNAISTNGGNQFPNPPHTVVSGLLANREQVNVTPWSSPFEIDFDQIYHVKPKIRIPESFVTTQNDTIPVCRIIIYSWAGIQQPAIKEVVIKGRNFRVFNNGSSYNGDYIEEFNFSLDPGVNLIIPATNDSGTRVFNPLNYNILEDGLGNAPQCEVDYRVEWLGHCDMWIDYVRVDDDIADQLFRASNNFDPWIQMEVNLATSSGNNPLKFYIEEFMFENIPCIKYVNQKIKEYSNNQYSLMCDVSIGEYYYMHRKEKWPYYSVPVLTAEYLNRTVINEIGLDEVYTFDYPFLGTIPNTPSRDKSGMVAAATSKIPNTLHKSSPNSLDYGIFAEATTPALYDDWLQHYFDDEQIPNCVFFTATMKLADATSKLANKPFVNIVQSHLWAIQNNAGSSWGLLREPTNEELKLISYLPITYGAKGQFFFWYGGWGNMGSRQGFGRGLTGTNDIYNAYDQRTDNVYEQNQGSVPTSKIATVSKINENLGDDKWGRHLMSFTNADRHSYIYRLQAERDLLKGDSYFSDVVTYKPGTQQPQCQDEEQSSPGVQNPPNMIYECNSERYLQVATFKKPSDISQYFMIVNRRCSPVDGVNEDGARQIKIRFKNDLALFPHYANWILKDLATNAVLITFNPHNSSYFDLGTFQPGEGKLYGVLPVLHNGGTLVADEEISGVTFTCESNVYSNGHNMTIGSNTHVSFTDTSKIIMTGGTFTVGNANVNYPQNITFESQTGATWHGYDFNNSEVKIYNSSFSKTTNDTISALNLIDCPVVDIRGNTFSTGNNTLQGCINAVYYNYVTILNQNFYIGGNTFNSNNSTVPALSASDYAGITMPVLIENNTFTSTSSGTTAILLSGITSGAIKSNTITDYSIGLNMLSASADIFNNTISSNINGSIGIYGTAGSELNMNASGDVMLGGLNNISFTGNGSKDILVENSIFDICYGQNIFNIFEADVSKHLAGYFPYSGGNSKPDGQDNCFKVNGSVHLPPLYSVLDGFEGQPFDISFEPYLTGCIQEEIPLESVISLGGGIYDTVGLRGGGNGGGYPVKREEAVIVTPKQMYDSICVQMRKHNYAAAKTKCFSMIDMFTDSLESLSAISKLFLAVIASDTSQPASANLKTYYETIILNHASNVSLVRRCNYFVQKCKVRMHQYSSAMAGFNEIMNQNPYSYEGLLARWDYMATSLLMNGQGGGSNTTVFSPYQEETERGSDISESDKSDESDKFDNPDGDKSPFTQKERSTIKQNVTTALETTKKRDTEKIKILQERSETGDETAKHELKIANTLKEIVKTEKPKNIIQHIKIVNGDVQKIFGSSAKSISKIQNSVPTVFKLYQNYPNPFNPVCVIKYDLPKDVKAVIKIYDILGREVKTLLNEFKKAGSYTANFDGSVYASGVYFYRIEAGDFVESKKMVMVK